MGDQSWMEKPSGSDEFYTPRSLFLDYLPGVRFDLDVASPGSAVVPWIPADRHITHDSLSQEWAGYVWCNPPYSNAEPFIRRLHSHKGGGIAILLTRVTSNLWFHDVKPDAAVFVQNRLKFVRPDGKDQSSHLPHVLLAYGPRAKEDILRSPRGWVVSTKGVSL